VTELPRRAPCSVQVFVNQFIEKYAERQHGTNVAFAISVNRHHPRGINMQQRQSGFGVIQAVMVVSIVAVIGLVAMPKYQAFVTKSQLTEALNIAHESKRKLEMYYMTAGHFPRTMKEAEAMKTETLQAPEYVREMTVAPKDETDIIVKVFIKDGVVENLDGAEQFVFIQGNQRKANGVQVEWICGAQGISTDLLPDNCKS
jgi:type IV pilus assembly protein PilA